MFFIQAHLFLPLTAARRLIARSAVLLSQMTVEAIHLNPRRHSQTSPMLSDASKAVVVVSW